MSGIDDGDFGQRLLISPIDPFESQLGFYFSYEPFSRPDLGYVLQIGTTVTIASRNQS